MRIEQGVGSRSRRWIQPLRSHILLTMTLCSAILSITGCGTVGHVAEDGHENAQSQPAFPLSLQRTVSADQQTRVLFIGNSFTFWRGGLWEQLERLSEQSDPQLGYVTSAVVRGGASLEVMWNRTDAAEKIAEGEWDVVVLQEDLPETNVDAFREYSRKFVDAVRAAGAEPIFYMTWEYDRLNWISLEEIIDTHLEMAAELQVPVAPVGWAWRLSREERPELDPYARDREHPSLVGMYLSLLLIESTISGADPRSRVVTEFPIRSRTPMEESDQQFLREIAARTLTEWADRTSSTGVVAN